jgi:uncharacterized delta-60 repeat protein
MPGYTKNSLSWTKTAPWGKSSGAWVKAKEAYANVAGTWRQWWLDGGVNDRTFTTNTGTGFNDPVYSVAVQSGGKIVIGGSFTTFNGVTVNNIVRLNSDGTRDTTFTTNTGTGFSGPVYSVATQSDGKIFCMGQFGSFNGATVERIVRLNSDGTRDTTFTTNIGTGFSSTVYSVATQSDGKIICVGDFGFFNETGVNRIVRLNSDGTRDTTFTANTGTGFNFFAYNIAVQSDGKIVIGGFFTTFNGATVNNIVRLNSDGTRDTTFTTNTGTAFPPFEASVLSIAIQPDGKIVIGGYFTTFNGATVNGIVRLNSDGTRDTTFTTNTGTGFDNTVDSISIQLDGKIVLGGYFTTFNGATVNRILRLNSNGTRDTTFTANAGTGFDSNVSSIAIQSDGKIICGGDFSTFNNINRTRIARIGGE